MKYSIVDIGSNTVRIVVYSVNKDGFECLFNEKEFVQLISYVKDGTMRDEGVRNLISALRRLLMLASHFNPDGTYCFATAPFRAVKDGAKLAEIVRTFTGLEVETLSGEQEAKLGLVGAQYQMHASDGLFVDLGGGSMEASLLKRKKVLYTQSIPQGCVNVSRRFVSGLLPTDKEMKKIKNCIDSGISEFMWLDEARGLDMYCIGGTARALGQMHQTLHGSTLPMETYVMDAIDIKGVYKDVLRLNAGGVKLMCRVCPGRIETLVPGAVMLWRLAKAAGAEKVHLSTYGVREGYLIQRVLDTEAEPRIARA